VPVKITPVKLELVQLIRMVDLVTDDEDDPENSLSDGTYAVDDQGRIWRLEKGISGVFAALTSDDPPHEQVRRKKERGE
jgi:hypothetical protein